MRVINNTNESNPLRRKLLKGILGASGFVLPGLALFSQALAGKAYAATAQLNHAWSKRPSDAFAEETLAPTLQALFGEVSIPTSEKIRVIAAELAENGAVVPVKVETDFAVARSITLLASKNPVPLVAQFVFSARVKPFVATRIKLAQSSEIIAIVETENGIFQSRRHVEVTIGGCSA